MLLLGVWNNLYDERCESCVNDPFAAMRFCGLNLDDTVPYHSTLSRFRSELTRQKAMDKLPETVNNQLDKHGLILQTGIKLDTSLKESPHKPKGKNSYEIAEDRKEDQQSKEEKKKQTQSLKKLQGKGVDSEGRWLKKQGRPVFGFKRHDAVDVNGIIVTIHTTTANEHDSKGFKPLLKKIANDINRRVFVLMKSGSFFTK